MFPLKTTLLAAALALTANTTQASTVTNLVTNGSFEDLRSTKLGNNSWGVFNNIHGWKTETGAGIELQVGNIGGAMAFDGNVKVELDSHGAGSNSTMIQKLTLKAGRYMLSFAYMGRIDGNPDDTNRVDYSVLGTGLAGTISKSYGAWEIVTALFKTDGKGPVTLRFAANGRQDTLGGYIDAVSVTPAPVPLPASLPLFGAALLGFGMVRRRVAVGAD